MSRWWILSDDFPPLVGGVATWSAAVAEGLARAGHEVTVLTRARAGLSGLAGGGVRVIGVPGRSFGRWSGWWLGGALAPRVRRGDRVLATTWPTATLLAGWPGAPPFELHVVAHGSDITRPPRDPAALRRVLARARWWSVSAFLAKKVEAYGVSCAVLPAPVEPAPRVPPDSEERWVMVGRATPLKGGDRAIRLASVAGVPLDLVGDGPELLCWRRLAASLEAEVRFWGSLPREEVQRVVSGAHLALLLPRLRADGTGAEGFGLTLAEAAALGVPGVGSEVGGVPEAVGPGLILGDPDAVADSMGAIRAWQTAERGIEAHRWLSTRHGCARLVALLEDG